MRPWLCAVLLLAGAETVAAPGPGRLQAYQASAQSEEQQAEALRRLRHRVGRFHEVDPPEPATAFPWLGLGFTLLALAVVVPFARAYFRDFTADWPGEEAQGRVRRRVPEVNPEDEQG
jgi:hypothetical protein